MAESDEQVSSTSKAAWFKFFPTEYLTQVGSMKAGERGVYVTLIAIMHDFGAPIINDARRLSKCAGTTKKAFDDAHEALLEASLIIKVRDRLWSPLVDRELENFARKSKSAQENARMV
jgi:hypothetical protein